MDTELFDDLVETSQAQITKNENRKLLFWFQIVMLFAGILYALPLLSLIRTLNLVFLELNTWKYWFCFFNSAIGFTVYFTVRKYKSNYENFQIVLFIILLILHTLLFVIK